MSRLFTVHLPERADPARAVLIEDRWRWTAFALPLLWALWNRRWLLALALLAAGAGTAALAMTGGPAAAAAVDLAVRLAMGFEAGAASRLELRLRGWRDLGGVTADSADAAALRWLRRRAGAAVPTAAPSGPWGAPG
ncbi:DUF2628 domain-containing protein [Rubrimonas cliftonensis]|uniref:DUF2628 domain-containing protein n=1 Tax=Rubrimonas cliftonensis TaxID=89524 RepID=A0A1H3YYT6_9RHOB|nr:DUF2628 domain-containing protein [Rubrimonas cliftonensis]SEA16224.1 Protein of unknown function [Rubrimonas cliftonensis]